MLLVFGAKALLTNVALVLKSSMVIGTALTPTDHVKVENAG